MQLIACMESQTSLILLISSSTEPDHWFQLNQQIRVPELAFHYLLIQKKQFNEKEGTCSSAFFILSVVL